MNLITNRISKNQSGFTLLELILSLAIVGIIISLGLGGIRLGISARDVGEKKVDTYQRLRIITEQLTQKLQSAYPVFVIQKDGSSIAQSFSSSKRIMAFEGESNSLRFVTFASPITTEGSRVHEVKFYLGKHPETEKTGLILLEKDISKGDIFSRIIPNAETTRYYLLAENVTELKFRYYEMKKLAPQELEQANNSPTHKGKWVNRVVMDPLLINQKVPTNPILAFERNNKISLPRAVEITLGITVNDEKEDAGKEPELTFSPPIVVLINSGMEIAVPEKKEEDNDKA
jgi:prepilin-type N-terminal cleavage/methylation domain-containing protein